MWIRSELKKKAKAALKKAYWPAVLVTLISMLVGAGVGGANVTYKNNEDLQTQIEQMQTQIETGAVTSSAAVPADMPVALVSFVLAFVGIAAIVVILIGVFLLAPIAVGCFKYFAVDAREGSYINHVLSSFGPNYLNIVKTMFLKNLYIFLWTLLFIIPGIIKAYQYFLVPYILADNPDMETKEILRLSKETMSGNKFKTFVLQLSFILWDILGAFTLGLLHLFFIYPYKALTYSSLYNTLCNKEVQAAPAAAAASYTFDSANNDTMNNF
ncbi:MAG: DUF975 family protein [Acetatifactor sp.]|nr:DUF975 family protein [Acetatifactor sp.]